MTPIIENAQQLVRDLEAAGYPDAATMVAERIVYAAAHVGLDADVSLIRDTLQAGRQIVADLLDHHQDGGGIALHIDPALQALDRIQAAREALRRIADIPPSADDDGILARGIARAALSESPGEANG